MAWLAEGLVSAELLVAWLAEGLVSAELLVALASVVLLVVLMSVVLLEEPAEALTPSSLLLMVTSPPS